MLKQRWSVSPASPCCRPSSSRHIYPQVWPFMPRGRDLFVSYEAPPGRSPQSVISARLATSEVRWGCTKINWLPPLFALFSSAAILPSCAWLCFKGGCYMIHLSPPLEMLRSHFISPHAAHYASCRQRLSSLGSDFINWIFSSRVKFSQCRRGAKRAG